jgi:DUF1707 SHOCT-like domain
LKAPSEGDTGPAGSSHGFRLSDADRDQIAEILATHNAAGRLTVQELEERVASLYRARSREEAAALIGDLPPLPSSQPRRHRGSGHGEARSPGAGWIATNERFRDPSTQRIMRVWVDPAGGTRHYVPDDDG